MANVLIRPHHDKIFQTSGRCYQTHAPRKLGQARTMGLGIVRVVLSASRLGGRDVVKSTLMGGGRQLIERDID
jgi:hypothetical protein